MKIKFILIFCLLSTLGFLHAEILIPMDDTQTDHLKAYGIAFASLKNQIVVKWLLNYRGGSYLFPNRSEVESMCKIRGVSYEKINSARVASILAEIQESNMDIVVLEKEPKIAVYVPPNTQPWDDAVTLALEYAQIEYDTLWDKEVLAGELQKYDWLHLHHEDFTGQYGKFYASFRNAKWYKEEVAINEKMAQNLGYDKVWRLKHAVAREIKEYVKNGGFLFFFFSSSDSFDIDL